MNKQLTILKEKPKYIYPKIKTSIENFDNEVIINKTTLVEIKKEDVNFYIICQSQVSLTYYNILEENKVTDRLEQLCKNVTIKDATLIYYES